MQQLSASPRWVSSGHARKEPFEQLVTSYSEHQHMSPRHGSPQCMSLHEHTWTSMSCTWMKVGQIALASRSTLNIDIRDWQVCIFTVRQDRSHRGHLYGDTWQDHLYPKQEVTRLTCLGQKSKPDLRGGRRVLYSKELLEQHIDSFIFYRRAQVWNKIKYITFAMLSKFCFLTHTFQDPPLCSRTPSFGTCFKNPPTWEDVCVNCVGGWRECLGWLPGNTAIRHAKCRNIHFIKCKPEDKFRSSFFRNTLLHTKILIQHTHN